MSENQDQTLDAYIRDNMKFIKVNDGESVIETYQGYEIVPDNFNPGQKTIAWQFDINGRTVSWTNGTSKVANQMKNFQPGDRLKISRSGIGPKTTYTITKAE